MSGDAPTAATSGALTASPCQPTEPRYIHLPDVLFRLRRRFPTVTESVFLECTRCHQWVAVPVLRAIPDELAEDVVAPSALGLDSIHERASSSGPLSHAFQDRNLRSEQLAIESVAPIRWRSSRLQEKEEVHSSADGGSGASQRNESAARHAEGKQDGVAPHFFYNFLQELRSSGRRASGKEKKEGNTTTPPNASSTQQQQQQQQQQRERCRLTELYIPNPDTFVCAGWQCAWDADALSELREGWMDKLYAALPLPTISDEALSSPSSSPSTSGASAANSLFPSSPTAARETRQQRRAALNKALAEELHVNHPRRQGRKCAARLTRLGEHGDQEPLPPLSLTSPPPPASSQSATPATENDAQLSRFQQAWVRQAALLLLRNGAGDAGEEEETTTTSGAAAAAAAVAGSPEEKSIGALLSAYCWAVCDACGKLRRVAQPFPGGAPFVCAMAVTTASSCRAARGAGHVENACGVSEVDGLVQCGVRLCEAELMAAALSSPFLPYPLKAQFTAASGGAVASLSRADVLRVLLGEPLLRTIHAGVTQAVLEGAESSASPPRRVATPKARRPTTPLSVTQGKRSNKECDADGDEAEEQKATAFLQKSLPVLRELARAIKKRSAATLARQLQLTPSQIQAKREAVVRRSLLDEVPASPAETVESDTPVAADKAQKAEEAAVKTEVKEAEDMTPAEAAKKSSGSSSHPQPNATAATAAAGSAEQQPSADSLAAPRPRGRRRQAPLAAPTSSSSRAAAAAAAAEKIARTPPQPSQLQSEPDQESQAAEGEARAAEPAQRKRGRPRKAMQESAPAPIVEVAAVSRHAVGATAATPSPRLSSVVSEAPCAVSVPPTIQTNASSPEKKANDEEEEQQQRQPQRESRGRGRGRGRGRPPNSSKTPRAEAEKKARKSRRKEAMGDEEDGDEDDDGDVSASDAWEIVHWVQCDNCSKWRIVPEHVPSTVRRWECHMRFDKARGRPSTCDDLDDADLSS